MEETIRRLRRINEVLTQTESSLSDTCSRIEKALQIVVNVLGGPSIVFDDQNRVIFESARADGITEIDEIVEAVRRGERRLGPYRLEVRQDGQGWAIIIHRDHENARDAV